MWEGHSGPDRSRDKNVAPTGKGKINMSTKVQVVGICGSLRPGSHTHQALAVALSGAKEAGAETQLIDLRQYKLIFCDGGDAETTDVLKLRAGVKPGHGIII